MNNPNIYFPKKMDFELTAQVAKAFIKEDIDGFLDFIFLAYPYAADGYLDDNQDELTEFILSGGAG